MGWIFLTFAIIFEIIWAMTIKSTEGFSRLLPSVLNVTLYLITLFFLSKAMKDLPTSLAYSMWTGLGSIGVAILAVYFQGEDFSIQKGISIALIVMGVVGLKM